MISKKAVQPYVDWIASGGDDLTPLWGFPMNARGAAFFELAAYASLIWPAFHVRDGAVLLVDNSDDDNYEYWSTHDSGSRSDLEAMLNHVHLEEVVDFGDDERELGLIVLETIKAAWTAKLAMDFPSDQFAVDLLLDDPIGITFYHLD